MDEAREPLLMLAVAVAVAVYKALLYVQGNEAQVRADYAKLKAENKTLTDKIVGLEWEIDRLRGGRKPTQPERPTSPKARWSDDNPPW